MNTTQQIRSSVLLFVCVCEVLPSTHHSTALAVHNIPQCVGKCLPFRRTTCRNKHTLNTFTFCFFRWVTAFVHLHTNVSYLPYVFNFAFRGSFTRWVRLYYLTSQSGTLYALPERCLFSTPYVNLGFSGAVFLERSLCRTRHANQCNLFCEAVFGHTSHCWVVFHQVLPFRV